MNIAVLVKILPDDQDIAVNADGTLDYSRAKNTVSTYDLNAIEAAAQLAAITDAHLTAITVGSKGINDSKTKKNILSRGVDDLHMLDDDELGMADSHRSAAAIAALVEKIGAIDLIICGDGSADFYAQQVDVQVAEILGWNSLNAAVKIEIENDVVAVSRILENESEVIKAALPVVVAVSPDIALPRITGMKDILAAGKKPVTNYALGDIGGLAGPSTEILDVRAPEPTTRTKVVFSASEDEGIDKFVTALREAL